MGSKAVPVKQPTSLHARQDESLVKRKLTLGLAVGIVGFVFALVGVIFVFLNMMVLWYFMIASIVAIVCGIVGTIQVRGAHLLGADAKRCIFPLVLSLLDIVLGTAWLVFVVVVITTYMRIWSMTG